MKTSQAIILILLTIAGLSWLFYTIAELVRGTNEK